MATFSDAERRMLRIAGIGHFFSHFFMIAQAVLALKIAPEFARDFGLSTGQTLALTGPSYLLFGLGSLPAGWITDRWHARGMLAVFMLGSGLSAMAAGLAAGPTALALTLAGVGLFASIYHPAGLTRLRNAASESGLVQPIRAPNARLPEEPAGAPFSPG